MGESGEFDFKTGKIVPQMTGYFHNKTFSDLHCMIAQGLCRQEIRRRIAAKYHNSIKALNNKLKGVTNNG